MGVFLNPTTEQSAARIGQTRVSQRQQLRCMGQACEAYTHLAKLN